MSKWLLVEYPPCSTCQKARRWLQEHGVDFASRHIKEERPSEVELREWAACSGLPLKRFFNTSGLAGGGAVFPAGYRRHAGQAATAGGGGHRAGGIPPGGMGSGSKMNRHS